MQTDSAHAAASSQPPIRRECLYLSNGIPFQVWKPNTSDGSITKMNQWMSSWEGIRRNSLQKFWFFKASLEKIQTRLSAVSAPAWEDPIFGA